MTIIIGFAALIIAILGWVGWFMSVSTPKPWAEFFKFVFACGFLAFCFLVGGTLESCSTGSVSSGPPVRVIK